MKTNTTILAIASVLVFAGCAQFHNPRVSKQDAETDYWIGPAQTHPSGQAGALLLYAEYLRNLPAADYSRELEHARQLAAEDKSFYRQLQYALALSAPGGDARKALQIIDGLTRENPTSNPELVALANLVSVDIAERRRLESRLEASARHTDDLEKKVEAVKNIEKSLIQRDNNTEKKQ